MTSGGARLAEGSTERDSLRDIPIENEVKNYDGNGGNAQTSKKRAQLRSELTLEAEYANGDRLAFWLLQEDDPDLRLTPHVKQRDDSDGSESGP